MSTSVLVGYATHHGATRGIAERIAARLRSDGVSADVRSVDEVRDAGPYDAFVIGSALYMFRWLGEAKAFLHRHHDTLERRPVWLFSSGPLGAEAAAAGTEAAAAGTEASVTGPKDLGEMVASVRARGHRVFAGAYDPSAAPVGLVERFTRLMPAARDTLPAGDFRDWDEIDAWADEIAAWLQPVAAGDARTGVG